MSLLDTLFGPPNLAWLTRQVVRRLQGEGWSDIQFDLDMSEVTASKNGNPTRFYLGNLLHDVSQAKRKDRAAKIDRFLAGVGSDEVAVPKDYATALPRLIPLVRTQADLGIQKLSALRLADSESAWTPVLSRPLVGELVVVIACDSPTALSYVNEDFLAHWNRTFEEVLVDALSNLRALPENPGWIEMAPGVWSGEWGDAYESSRILIADLIHRLGLPDPVAMVPFRNSLLLASARNPAAVFAMGKLVQSSLENANRWLSFEPLRLDGQTWQPYEPLPGQRSLFDDLKARGQSSGYSSQKELLDHWHEKTHVDVFVAGVQHVHRDGEPLQSYAVWSEEVDTLLPICDLVALRPADDAAPTVLSRWADVVELAGGWMETTDLSPARMRVRRFPNPDVVEALRART